MSLPMLYVSCLCGYTPYARRLRIDPTEWIIQRMVCKRKSANLFILFRAMNKIAYHILLIIHPYNVGTSQLRSCMPTLVVHPNFGHTSGLRSHIMTPVSHIMTPVTRPDSGRSSRLQLRVTTTIIYPDSDRALRL
jgi:hypothetical protein